MPVPPHLNNHKNEVSVGTGQPQVHLRLQLTVCLLYLAGLLLMREKPDMHQTQMTHIVRQRLELLQLAQQRLEL